MTRLKKTSSLAAVAVLALGCVSTAFAQGIPVAEGEISGTRVEITELKRTAGDTVTLRFALVNDSGERIGPHAMMGGSSVNRVHLIDTVNRKKYLVVKDAGGVCVCSTKVEIGLKSGDRLNLWARFPAPPADVRQVSVVVPMFIPVDEVPISQ